MIIQKIFPPGNNPYQLYYKELDNLKRERDVDKAAKTESSIASITFPMELKRGHIYSFGTYVNALSIDRWTGCTSVDNITIVIRTTGSVRIQVYNSTGGYRWGDTVRASGKRAIDADVFCEERGDYKEYIIELQDINYGGIIYPIIEVLEDCRLLGGEYTTNTPIDASEVKPVAIINYNKDANTTKQNIKAIESYQEQEIPIIVCDMTGNLSEQSLVDRAQGDNKVITISTSLSPGEGYNKAFEYIDREYGDTYTHAIMIDYNVEITTDAPKRLLTFLSLLDDIRSDMIIQGDVLRDGTINDGCGYIIRDNKGISRFQGFDMSATGDYVAYESYDELDYYSLGLICMPLNAISKNLTDKNGAFDPRIRQCVELDYYLRHKPLSITTLNGFFAHKNKRSCEGLVKSYYYRYRDDYIARVDTDLELALRPFRDYIDAEYRRELKRGNLELAFTIIEATNDFMKGPKIFEAEYEEDVARRIAQLTKMLNDNIIGRKLRIGDRIRLEQEYNKLCLKIDSDYDMILQEWA